MKRCLLKFLHINQMFGALECAVLKFLLEDCHIQRWRQKNLRCELFHKSWRQKIKSQKIHQQNWQIWWRAALIWIQTKGLHFKRFITRCKIKQFSIIFQFASIKIPTLQTHLAKEYSSIKQFQKKRTGLMLSNVEKNSQKKGMFCGY